MSTVHTVGTSLVADTMKNLTAMQETGFDPWRRQPTPVFLPGESHGQSSLAGYSPQGQKKLDMTEWLTHTHIVDSDIFYTKSLDLSVNPIYEYTFTETFSNNIWPNICILWPIQVGI